MAETIRLTGSNKTLRADSNSDGAQLMMNKKQYSCWRVGLCRITSVESPPARRHDCCSDGRSLTYVRQDQANYAASRNQPVAEIVQCGEPKPFAISNSHG